MSIGLLRLVPKLVPVSNASEPVLVLVFLNRVRLLVVGAVMGRSWLSGAWREEGGAGTPPEGGWRRKLVGRGEEVWHGGGPAARCLCWGDPRRGRRIVCSYQ